MMPAWPVGRECWSDGVLDTKENSMSGSPILHYNPELYGLFNISHY